MEQRKTKSYTLSAALWCLLIFSPLARADTPPDYKIIYNWDGAPHGYTPYPQTLEQFLQKTFAPIKDTQVGALFFCVGEHEATWPSTKLELSGNTLGRRYQSVRAFTHHENIRAMLDRGENPYQAMVERGRQLGIEVYVSIRMNDNHFNGLQLDDMATTSMSGLTQLRKDHPEWCLGPEDAPPWFALSWNMAIPEVREHRFQFIREAIEQADWDGVELDWQRHGFHLPAKHGARLSYTLTDLQRQVRKLTNGIARRRGRPFHVAVRVATTMESCRKIGYDLKTWVKEGLCDMIIAGGGAGTDPGVDVEAFRELIRGAPITFYPGFDSGFWGKHDGLVPHEEWQRRSFRGWAKSYWERGSNGMYVFNWHGDELTRRDLLTTMGAPETLGGTDKVFAALHRNIRESGNWAGADLNDRIYGTTPVELYRTLTASGPHFLIGVHDDVVREAEAGRVESVELHVELEHFAPGDRVAVSLDGRALGPVKVRIVPGAGSSAPYEVNNASWLVWSLQPPQASKGSHDVGIRLLERNPLLRPPLVIRLVEFHVNYRS